MVRIWGKWCGPDWTAGQRIPAKDYDWSTDPHPSVKDDLDAACKVHDRVYGQGGNRKQADKVLEMEARRIRSQLKRQGKGYSKKAKAASRIALGMTIKRRW